MPMFDYRCNDCRETFEVLLRDPERDRVSCPECRSPDCSRLLSVFAIGAAAPRMEACAPRGGCGTCGDPRGPGACQLD